MKNIAVLGVLLLVSALSLVMVRHYGRVSFVELQGLQAEQDQLGVEWNRLLLERETWSLYHMVDYEARRKLDMTIPDASQTVTLFVSPVAQ